MVKAILGAVNKEKAIVETFSGNCQTSRRFVVRSSDDVAAHLGVRLRVLHAAGDGGAAVTPTPCSTAAGSPLYTPALSATWRLCLWSHCSKHEHPTLFKDNNCSLLIVSSQNIDIRLGQASNTAVVAVSCCIHCTVLLLAFFPRQFLHHHRHLRDLRPPLMATHCSTTTQLRPTIQWHCHTVLHTVTCHVSP